MHDHEAVKNVRAHMSISDPLHQQHDPAEVVHRMLFSYRSRLQVGLNYLRQQCYSQDEWGEYTVTGKLSSVMKQGIVNSLGTTILGSLHPTECLKRLQNLFAPFTIKHDNTTWPAIINSYISYSTQPQSISKSHYKRPLVKIGRKSKIHKSESSSDDNNHPTSISTVTRDRHSQVLNKLLETVMGFGQRLQTQTEYIQSQTTVVTRAFTTALTQQRSEIIDLIDEKNDTLEKKLQEQIQSQLQQYDQRQLRQLAEWDEQRRSLVNPLTEVCPTDDKMRYNECHRSDWILDADVLHWKEVYVAEWNRLNPTNNTAYLPATTVTTERGLHHALQRMVEGERYPCDPVYAAEVKFFNKYAEVRESPTIRDGVMGLIGKISVKRDVYFHYHGKVHYPIEGETNGPYNLTICRGLVQLDGSEERDGLRGSPVSLNEYIWRSSGNNIEFSDNIHRHDVGRMRTKEPIPSGGEWFLEYDKCTNNYDWYEALVHRTNGILKNLQQMYERLSWDTSVEKDELKWALWLMQNLEDVNLRKVLEGIAQHSGATAAALATKRNFPLTPPTLVSSKTQLCMVIRIMVEAYQVANGTHGKKTNHNNVDAIFSSVPLHSVFFRLVEYQLENGLRTRHDPERLIQQEDEYFVNVAKSMHAIGMYVYRYQTDSRLHDQTQSGYQTRQSCHAAVQSLPNTTTSRNQSEKELRQLLDTTSADIGPINMELHKISAPVTVKPPVQQTILQCISSPLQTKILNQQHLPLDWSGNKIDNQCNNVGNNSNNPYDTQSNNLDARNVRGKYVTRDAKSLMFDTTLPLKQTDPMIFQATSKFRLNPYMDHNDEHLYSKFDIKPKVNQQYSGRTTNDSSVQSKHHRSKPIKTIDLHSDEEYERPVITRINPAASPPPPPREIRQYSWHTLTLTKPHGELQICDADFFRGVKPPYREPNPARTHPSINKCDVRYYTTPNSSSIHKVLNELRTWCASNHKSLQDWGTAIYNGIIFNAPSESATKNRFENLRESCDKFIDPENYDGADYTVTCIWIEGMLFAILKIWRKPITNDIALTWLNKTKMGKADFSNLKELCTQIQIYAGHLSTAVNGTATAEEVLRYVRDALKRTDSCFVGSTLFDAFNTQYGFLDLKQQLLVASSGGKSTSSNQLDVLEQTIDHFTMMLEDMSRSSTIGSTTLSVESIAPISWHEVNYDNHLNYRPPTLEGSRFTNTDIPNDIDESHEWEREMDNFAAQCIDSSERQVLIQCQVQVTTKMGTGVYIPYKDNLSKLCTACGDSRHLVDRCFVATHDGYLSLPALSFLDETLSEKKLFEAQQENCSLYGQPQEVITTVRNIVNRMRKHLTTLDRETNARNKRDALAQKNRERGLPPGRRTLGTSVAHKKPSVPATIPGATLPLRITEQSASIKTIRQQEIVDKRNSREQST